MSKLGKIPQVFKYKSLFAESESVKKKLIKTLCINKKEDFERCHGEAENMHKSNTSRALHNMGL